MTNESKRDTAITAEMDTGRGELRLVFSNGEAITVQIRELSQDMVTHATLHGLKQKLVDAAALIRNPDTGRSATIADKYAAVREVFDRLMAGQWNKGRGDGSGSVRKGGLLFRALCRLYAGKPPEQIRGFLNGKSKEELAALRKNARVAAIIEELVVEELKAESTKTGGVDSDALLEGLED